MTTATAHPAPRRTRVSLSCLYCGHEVGDVITPAGRRPTLKELRATYAAAPEVVAPAWDAHGQPRCPRCAAKLFMEIAATSRPYVEAPRSRAPESETEDAYAREDVYVSPSGVSG